MSSVRVLVGTKKGAFVLTSDASRKQWNVEGPHFAGWEVYHVKGSPADPDRLYASQTSGWFGQVMQRSDDAGKTWEAVGNQFAYEGTPGTHVWYDGSPHPYEFKRVWHLEPSLTDPETVYAGVEDAAIFKSTDGGTTWAELPGLRTQETSPGWAPGAGGLCLHTILIDPSNADRMFGAISSAGVFRTDDAGQSWRPINRGLRSNHIPDHQRLPPLRARRQAARFPQPDRRQRVGGADQRTPTEGLLRQRASRRHGGRFARSLRRLLRHERRSGLRVPGRGRPVGTHRPRSAAGPVRRGSDTGVIRVVLPANLQTLAGVGRVVELDVAGPVTQRSVLDALEGNHPALRGTIRDVDTKRRRPMLRFFACEEDLSDASPDDPLPDAVASGSEPLLIIGAIAGG